MAVGKRKYDLGGDDIELETEGGSAWLESYSDMMTDLLAIFVVLFSFAMMSVSQQNSAMRSAMEVDQAMDSGGGGGVTDSQHDVQEELKDEFDEVYESIKEKIEEGGYSDSILLEKNESFITFRFRDNVLFYPDSSSMRETSFDILQYMGDLLKSVDDKIFAIEISGHTARVGEDSTTNFFAWELSSDRAIAVLQFFVRNCDLPQAKMVVSGYAHHNPVAGNELEEERQKNRRVEVKIVRSQAIINQAIDSPIPNED